MIDYCYHTHTYRCGHAVGKEEEYVLSAIKHGIKVLGFSDHVFIPGLEQEGIRGHYSELDDYIDTVNELKEKYKDQIEIHLGFECEYSEKLDDYYHYLLEEKGVEYLIQGQHLFFLEDGTVDWLFSHKVDRDAILKRYVDELIKGMISGLFSYIAHPDLFIKLYEEITPYVEEQMRRICAAAAKYHVPLEINLGGIRFERYKYDKLTYANERFFQIASEYDVEVIVGVDAHNPNDFDCDISDYDFAEMLINAYHLKHKNRLKLK